MGAVCEILSHSESTVRRLVAAGRLEAPIKSSLGRSRRFLKSSVDRYIVEQIRLSREGDAA